MLREYYEHMTHALMHIPDMGEESNSVWYHLSPQECQLGYCGCTQCCYLLWIHHTHAGSDKHWITHIYDKSVVAIVQLGSAALRGIYE